MVRELYLKYKDRYFEDFFTPEVRDLPKDKKELLLNELETMRKNTAIVENRRDHAEEEDWEEEVWECDKALKNIIQRGIIASHLILDLPNKLFPLNEYMLNAQEVSEVLDTASLIAKEKQSDLYHAVKWKWPYYDSYKVSDSGKIFYEQCMRNFCDPQKRERFLSIVNAPRSQKLKTNRASRSNKEMER